MHYHKSLLKKLKEECFGIYYDYRKIAFVFFCYSLLGTGLILGTSSLFDEDITFHHTDKKEPENQEKEPETIATEAAASKNQSIQDVLDKIKSHTTSYSLTGNTPESGKEALPNSAKDSQKDAQESTAARAAKDKDSNKKEKTLYKPSKNKEKNTKPYRISDYSKKELEILERIVEAEAGDQTLKGRIMVAHVVLNRVASDEFPDTIKKVVFQKNKSTYQFSPIKDGRYYDVKISKKTKKAVAKAFESSDLTDGALYFMSRSGSSKKNIKWFDSSLTRITSYGCHEFFK